MEKHVGNIYIDGTILYWQQLLLVNNVISTTYTTYNVGT